MCTIAILRYVKYTQLNELNLAKGGGGETFLVLPVIHNKLGDFVLDNNSMIMYLLCKMQKVCKKKGINYLYSE